MHLHPTVLQGQGQALGARKPYLSARALTQSCSKTLSQRSLAKWPQSPPQPTASVWPSPGVWPETALVWSSALANRPTNVDAALKTLREEGLRVEGVVCHVAKAEDRKALLDCAMRAFGQLDVLVSNAAVNPAMGAFLDTTEKEFEKIFEVNVKSAFLLTKEAVPLMSKGSIVYVSSIGAYQPFPLISAYSVSKTALLGVSRAVALQCAPNIRANVVCPGVIRTRFSEPLWQSEAAMEEIERLVPMGRIGEPEEVANLVAFLASDQSSYITGESLTVAGGHFSRL